MNQLALMLTAYLALVGQLDNLRSVSDDEWQSFKLTYDKSYENQQIESLRRSVYAVNKAKLETKQTQLKQSNASYEIGINKFTDWTANEMDQVNGLRTPADYKPQWVESDAFTRQLLRDDGPLPDQFDWRKVSGRVSEVRDQGICGSCWAFAAVGALEGQEKVNSGGGGKLTILSPQNLVDCVYQNSSWPHSGCAGGLQDHAYAYVDSVGIEAEKSYPYTGEIEDCRHDAKKSVLTGRGFVDLPQDEEKIRRALVKSGPVSVGINGINLFSYMHGIFSDVCRSHTNHAVLLVGYGTDPKLGDFWIVKNSWGKDWGEGGYFRLARGSNSACVGIQAALPQL